MLKAIARLGKMAQTASYAKPMWTPLRAFSTTPPNPEPSKKSEAAPKQSQARSGEERFTNEEYDDEDMDIKALRPKSTKKFNIGLFIMLGGLASWVGSYYAYKKKLRSKYHWIPESIMRAGLSLDVYITGIGNVLTKPMKKKLLPDIPPNAAFIPKTFVLNLTGTLISSNYEMGKGYMILKRPGLETFLARLSRLGEVVIFADEDLMFLSDIYPVLDPKSRIVSAMLGRESTVYEYKGIVKDLSYLNRDLNNVIMIDWDPKKIRRQPQNLLVLKKFENDNSDRELFDALPFLEHLASPSILDVRDEIAKYGTEEGYKKFIEELADTKRRVMDTRQAGLGGIFDKIDNASKKQA